MKKVAKDFINLLFEPAESICVSPDKYAYHSIEQSTLESGRFELTSSGERHFVNKYNTEDILLCAINPISGFRSDEKVTAYRSFLIEVDTGTILSQKQYIEEELKMPFSVCVFSGNKSLHYGIVLDRPLPSVDLWRKVNQWILNIVEKADQQVKNPSRCIRFPGNIRKERGLEQSLVSIKSRISLDDLFIWLNNWSHLNPAIKEALKVNTKTEYSDISSIPSWVVYKLENGLDPDKGRNNQWYSIAFEFAKNGFIFNEIVEALEPYYVEDNDFKRIEWEKSIESACKKNNTF